jgi:hypothetical protein
MPRGIDAQGWTFAFTCADILQLLRRAAPGRVNPHPEDETGAFGGGPGVPVFLQGFFKGEACRRDSAYPSGILRSNATLIDIAFDPRGKPGSDAMRESLVYI